MNFLKLEIPLRYAPELDPSFIPIGLFHKAFLESAGDRQAVGIALERQDGQIAVSHTYIHGTAEKEEADFFYIDRLVKTLLWMKGGYRLYVSGNKAAYDYLSHAYSQEGSRAFDSTFMAGVYEHPFEVIWSDKLPEEKSTAKKVGGHMEGCRIGFDAGGSDRKVSAVVDGNSVFDEEVVWFPKTNADPTYHYEGIVSALKTAAAHLPRVDAVGVSSAGIFINDRAMVSSLFRAVPEELHDQRTKDLFIRAIRDTFGDIPFAVANDGDVSALAGMQSLGKTSVLGIAMGTSEAAGYVDAKGCVTGWLNELAFVPVDCSPNAMRDEWSGDIGCGVKYFSQDAVIKLAPRAGIELSKELSPAEKLKKVQSQMEAGDPAAERIYDSIGVYLGHTLAHYYDLYSMNHVLLLGRVMSGEGGNRILQMAQKVLEEEYPDTARQIAVALPDERFRRVGQSAVAAGLPECP